MSAQISPTTFHATDPITRRVLLERALQASVAVGVTGMVVPAAIYLWPMRREGPESGTVDVGATTEIAVGGGRLVKARETPVLLVRESEAEIRAFSAICTHLGCLVQWRKDSQDIFCPCHGGRFALDGRVIGGPPPRPLPQYAVEIADGRIRVDLKSA